MKTKLQNTILIIDDNVQDLKTLTGILKSGGFSVNFCTNINSAIELSKSIEFDLIVINFGIKNNQGVKICEELRTYNRLKNTAIIFSISDNNEQDILKGLSLGCVDYINIPYRKEEVLVRIKTQINLRLERIRNFNLLSNILPLKAIKRLKSGQTVEADTYENVAILFTDLNNFTKRSYSIPPSLLIEELNDIFTHFDEITEKYNCERIKTIGDAYMAVSSLCYTSDAYFNLMSIAKSAIEMMHYLQNRKSKINMQWEMRAGIHYGKVIGGVVGVKKYLYDIFGKTVNIAARMEQYSEASKINVSEDVKNILSKDFDFEKRKLQNVKGLGETQMYYLKY